MAKAIHIISIVVFFVVGLLASFSPLYFARKQSFLTYLNIFAAGVFLAIGLMTILDEAVGDLAETADDLYGFPIAYFLAVVGYLIIFATEQVIHEYFDKTFGSEAASVETISGETIDIESGGQKSPVANVNFANSTTPHSLSTSQKESDVPMQSAVVLLIAISIHEILEGFAIGALENPTWGLFFALLFHKIVESFAVGAAFVRADTRPVLFWTFLFLYGLTLPLGIGIGLASAATGNVGTGIVLALSAGSFIFLATTEIIPAEFDRQKANNLVWRYCALGLGFLLMSLLIFFEEYAEHTSGASSEASSA